MAQTFQATLTAKVNRAVPPVMPAANERLIQFGMGCFGEYGTHSGEDRLFGSRRFVIADQGLPRLMAPMPLSVLSDGFGVELGGVILAGQLCWIVEQS